MGQEIARHKLRTFFLLSLLVSFSRPIFGQEKLDLQAYLKHVQEKHDGLRGSQKLRDGLKARAAEKDLITAPALFANVLFSGDSRQTMNPAFQGTRTIYDSYSLGVMKQTTFGMQAKLSYNVSFTSIENATLIPLPNFYDARPLLEISQSLWKNGFGSETRAQMDVQESQTLAQSFAEGYKAKMMLFEAEATYWRLVLAREAVEVQRASLERARKIVQWASRRARDDLADKADVWQAEAAFQVRELELQAALDEEKAASRSFNALLGNDTDTVAFGLEKIDPALAAKAEIPKRAKSREDVLAAEQGQKAALAVADLTRDRHSPTLDLVGSASLNARDSNPGPATGKSFNTEHPAWSLGVKFQTSLDFGLAAESRAAASLEKEGAELVYKRKVFEQEREWDDLQKRFDEVKRRLTLAEAMEATQEKKLKYERNRHERGRSTTFQVLQFEQDFALSQLSRIRVESELLRLIAQMKTFSGGDS